MDSFVKFLLENTLGDGNYFKIGHYGSIVDYDDKRTYEDHPSDAWLILKNEDNIRTALKMKYPNIDEFHRFMKVFPNADACGRIDFNKKAISVVFYCEDQERKDYIKSLLKFEYPEFNIVQFMGA